MTATQYLLIRRASRIRRRIKRLADLARASPTLEASAIEWIELLRPQAEAIEAKLPPIIR